MRRGAGGRQVPPSAASAIVGPSWRRAERGVAEEARTRGFAAPAFAGCAFVEGERDRLRGGTRAVNYRHSGGTLP